MATARKQLPDVLTPRQVMAYLQLGRDSVYQLLSSGALPSVRIGRTYRVPRRSLEQWLEQQTAESLPS